jgi:hypothetical protein
VRNIFEIRRNKASKALRAIDKADHKRGFIINDIPDFTQGTIEHVIVVLEQAGEEKKIGRTRIRHLHAIDKRDRTGNLISSELFHV